MEEELLERIQRLEKELKSTKYLIIFFILMFIMLAYQYITIQQKKIVSADMVHTKGLVIRDSDGQDVMLMGYPVPYSEDRKREDVMDGVLILDGNGNDRLFMGREGAVQVGGQTFSRIDNGWGFLVNDQGGNERGNFSMLDSLNAMVMGMDYPAGEGLMMAVQPGGAFLVINADTTGIARERIILRHERNGKEETFISVGNPDKKEPLILRQ